MEEKKKIVLPIIGAIIGGLSAGPEGALIGFLLGAAVEKGIEGK